MIEELRVAEFATFHGCHTPQILRRVSEPREFWPDSVGTVGALEPGMTPQELRARTEAFATAVAEFAEPLFDGFLTRDQARQLLRAADAMASNYRAAGRGRSHAEFTAKIGVVLEEADEVEGCLQRLRGRGKVDEARRRRLANESEELVRIFSASAATARNNAEERKKRKRRNRNQDANPE